MTVSSTFPVSVFFYVVVCILWGPPFTLKPDWTVLVQRKLRSICPLEVSIVVLVMKTWIKWAPPTLVKSQCFLNFLSKLKKTATLAWLCLTEDSKVLKYQQEKDYYTTNYKRNYNNYTCCDVVGIWNWWEVKSMVHYYLTIFHFTMIRKVI